MATDFVEFVFLFCTRTSHGVRSFVNVLVQEDSDLFEHVTPSDIAWGVTTYINNQEYLYKNIQMEESVEEEGTPEKARTEDGGGVTGDCES